MIPVEWIEVIVELGPTTHMNTHKNCKCNLNDKSMLCIITEKNNFIMYRNWVQYNYKPIIFEPITAEEVTTS